MRSSLRNVRTHLRSLSRQICRIGLACSSVLVWAEEQVPNSQCPCVPPVGEVPWHCTVQTRCIFTGPGRFIPATDEWPPPYATQHDTLTCDNCNNCATTMDCFQSLCVTTTDEAQVSYSGSFSLGAKATINALLAGGIEISTTAEFSAGNTSTTSVSVEHCVQCGASNIPACAGAYFELKALEQNRSGRLELFYRWDIRTDCWLGGSEDWHPHVDCAEPAYASIAGSKGLDSGCVGRDIECGYCRPCPGIIIRDP